MTIIFINDSLFLYVFNMDLTSTGICRPRRDQAPPHSQIPRPNRRQVCHRPNERVLASPTILLRRLRRGLHLHRTTRLLPQGVPEGDEDDEHGAVPNHIVARVLLQLDAGDGGAQDHRREARVARRQPEPGQAVQFLLAAGDSE